MGFQLQRRRSSRVGPVVVTDLDFAEDLALLSSGIKKAQKMASNDGLHLNFRKTGNDGLQPRRRQCYQSQK